METEVSRSGEVVSQPGVADITEHKKRVNIEYEDHPCSEEQRSLEMPAAFSMIAKAKDCDLT